MSQVRQRSDGKKAVIYVLRRDTIQKLKNLATTEHRTYSAQLEHLIEREFNKVFPLGFAEEQQVASPYGGV